MKDFRDLLGNAEFQRFLTFRRDRRVNWNTISNSLVTWATSLKGDYPNLSGGGIEVKRMLASLARKVGITGPKGGA
jgi:hypothetical protein